MGQLHVFGWQSDQLFILLLDSDTLNSLSLLYSGTKSAIECMSLKIADLSAAVWEKQALPHDT